jgi:RNA polymerase sigma factor (sigma-70 family)
VSDSALDAWVLETAPRAVAYARSLLNQAHDAEDIVQDCYCRLIAKKDQYDLPRDGLKLLLTAISNACINHKTRRKPFFRLSQTDRENGEDVAIDPADLAALPPLVEVETAEFQQRIAEGLQRLTPPQRAAIELKSLGHSQQEIAEILRITPTNAGVLIFRARKALSEFLTPYLDREAMS